jgi:hypothetical protein
MKFVVILFLFFVAREDGLMEERERNGDRSLLTLVMESLGDNTFLIIGAR